MSVRDVLLALLVVCIWGVNFVTIKWSTDEISPFMLTALRYIGCALPAVFLVKPPKTGFKIMIAYGVTVGILQFSFLFTAVRNGMPTGLASLVMQVQVFFTMGLAALFLGERPAPVQLGGAAIAFVGLVAIGGEQLGGLVFIPFIFTLIAAFFWSSSNIVTKLAGKVDMFAFVVWGSLVPPIPMIILSLIFEGPGAFVGVFHAGPLALASAGYIAYGSTLIGYGTWARLLGKYPASLVAPFTLLVPVVGFVAGYLAFGEEMTRLEVLGSLLILAGLSLNVIGPRVLKRRKMA